ncbi:MAG: energy-coupling factor transporter transmembrane component T [Eubacteriales bacterium]|nr:energy-coupling factor transporter transmembrane component T [Eubacteriales bacterium]
MTHPAGRNGQKGSSGLVGINPAVKLMCLILSIAAVLCCRSPIGFAVAAVVTTAIVYISSLSAGDLLRSYKKLIILFSFILLVNTLFYSPRYSFAGWWIFRPSVVGAIKGIVVIFKSVLVAALLEVFAVSVSRSELSDVFAFLLSPLRYIGLPAAKIASAVSESVCVIPELLFLSEETQLSERTQERDFLEKGKAALVRTLSVLIVSSLQNAEKRAEYLNSRGLGLDRKVQPYFSYRIKQLGVCDLCAFLVCASFWAMEVLVL